MLSVRRKRTYEWTCAPGGTSGGVGAVGEGGEGVAGGDEGGPSGMGGVSGGNAGGVDGGEKIGECAECRVYRAFGLPYRGPNELDFKNSYMQARSRAVPLPFHSSFQLIRFRPRQRDAGQFRRSEGPT